VAQDLPAVPPVEAVQDVVHGQGEQQAVARPEQDDLAAAAGA
jgi:hypothetical protein